MRDANARFQVDTRLARLLGEGYRTSEAALKELVDNAWDADARNVWITLPEPMTGDPVVVRDDGLGMTAAAMRDEYLKIASDRRQRSGTRTYLFQRKAKGRKGIGKFAGLLLARTMRVETVARGRRCIVLIDKLALTETDRDLETVDLPLEEAASDGADAGTTVTLCDLEARLNFPVAEKLREILVREYGREDGFAVTVNGKRLSVEDVPGVTMSRSASLPEAGPVGLRFTVSDGKRKLSRPGIVVRIDGKVVGEPSLFGLDEDEEIPRRLAQRIYGEIELSGHDDIVTPDWGGLIESSKAFDEIVGYIRREVKACLRETYRNEMDLQRARLEKRIKERIGKLPEFRRRYAEQAIHRILVKFYDENIDRIAAVAEVALDALEHDAYWAVLERINAASREDVGSFAASLNEFGLLELAAIGTQTTSRLRFLDLFQTLAERPETREAEIHRAVETNLWLLGRRYAAMASNRTLRDIVRRYGEERFDGPRAAMRPDLLLSQEAGGGLLLIEFKRPTHDIARVDVAQAEQYRDDLRRTFPSEGIDVLLIGRGRAVNLDVSSLAPGVSIQSYLGLISAARGELEWILGAVGN